MFPPPPGALLDTSLAADALRLPASPDVLLLPSELSPFAQLLPAAGDSKVPLLSILVTEADVHSWVLA